MEDLMNVFMLSIEICPWPCYYIAVGLVSAIVGGIVGYRFGFTAGLKAQAKH
jgi:hypothetical protein